MYLYEPITKLGSLMRQSIAIPSNITSQHVFPLVKWTTNQLVDLTSNLLTVHCSQSDGTNKLIRDAFSKRKSAQNVWYSNLDFMYMREAERERRKTDGHRIHCYE